MAPPKRKRLNTSAKKQDISKSQAFLNYLSADDAKRWLKEITEKIDHSDFINEKHIKSSLNLDQIISSTSITPPFDGAYFMKWMNCNIKGKNVLNPPEDHFKILISRNCSEHSSIKEKVSTFCSSNSINSIQILYHHIALRSVEPDLPVLSSAQSSSMQASHLCDTRGCIQKDHLTTETSNENTSRRLCFGILIQMYQKSCGNYCISQVKPCVHGRKLKGNLKQQVEHSCRTIRTSIASVQYIQSFK